MTSPWAGETPGRPDGHVKAPRAAYRACVEKKYLQAFDDWLRAEEASGRPDAGNRSPDLAPAAQWDFDRRRRDLESQGVFVETEVHWIAPALRDLDMRVSLGDEWTAFAAFLKRERAFSRLPSGYGASNCYAGVSPFHPNQLAIETLGSAYEPAPGEFTIGSDRAMFGVDYPHFETVYPATMERLAQLLEPDTVSGEDARRIPFDKAAEVYGFDRNALKPHVERVGFELGDVPSATPKGASP